MQLNFNLQRNIIDIKTTLTIFVKIVLIITYILEYLNCPEEEVTNVTTRMELALLRHNYGTDEED